MATNEQMLTFANYDLHKLPIEDIYAIGKDGAHPNGVIKDIATAFNYPLDEKPSSANLGGLIARVGPAKELQENLPAVQAALSTEKDSVGITRSWVERSGLLVRVERSYGANEPIPDQLDVLLATGGIRNWMERRAKELAGAYAEYRIDGKPLPAILGAGNRRMKPTEGPDVQDGMTEIDYMRVVVAKRLADLGITAHVVEVPSGIGDEVMKASAQKARELVGVGSDARILVASNAGAWTQNAGQVRRALRGADAFGPTFDTDGQQLFVAADSFPLGHGTEPAATHQNPYTAVGQIARNAHELAQQYGK